MDEKNTSNALTTPARTPAHPVAVGGATAALAAASAMPEGAANRRLISVGRGVLRVLEFVRLGLEPITRKIFGPDAEGSPASNAGFRNFEQEADAVMSRDQTHRPWSCSCCSWCGRASPTSRK